MQLYIIITSLFISFVLAAEKGSPCVTPNGENATCISIDSCSVIRQALTYLNDEVIEFARKSQCGYDITPLVCCGSVGRPTTVAPERDVFDVFSKPKVPTSSVATPIDNINLPDHSLCGIQILQERIVGGRATAIDEFPWMAALRYTKSDGTDGGFRCGGTLINKRHILTAAQCVNIPGYNLTGVRLGEWNFSSPNDCAMDTEYEEVCTGPPLDLAVIRIIPHPLYHKRRGTNDIALLKLEKSVKYNDFVRPICLPTADLAPPPTGTRLEVAGWGITDNGTQSDVKMKVKVPLLANEECAKIFSQDTNIGPNQACAGGEEGKDVCTGDSGGPLMTTYTKQDATEEEQWYQEGILYRGLGCGRKGIPSLYTRVAKYTPWILNSIH